MLVTDLPITGTRGKLPKGWSAHLSPDGEVLIWDGRNHASAGKRPHTNVPEACRQLKAHREWQDEGEPRYDLMREAQKVDARLKIEKLKAEIKALSR